MYGKYVELRDARGISDYRVSEDTGITKSTFSDWKSGRSKPKVDKLLILAKYFGVSVEELLEEQTDE
jgi:transcriptional regulator with XRE-family HTH domain